MMGYALWLGGMWPHLIKEYMQRPESNEQGWIEWTYDQYQKTTQQENLRGVVRDQPEGLDAGVPQGQPNQALVVAVVKGEV